MEKVDPTENRILEQNRSAFYLTYVALGHAADEPSVLNEARDIIAKKCWSNLVLMDNNFHTREEKKVVYDAARQLKTYLDRLRVKSILTFQPDFSKLRAMQ